MANPRARVIRTSSTSPAGIYIEDKAVTMLGNDKNFIVVDNRGITIKGPVSFVSDSMNRRTAGLFTGISDFLEMIPSTIVTPIPSKIPMPPVFAVNNIVRDIAFFMALLV